jgi:hypothetical protein
MTIAANGQPWGQLTNDHPIVIDHLIHLYDGLANQIATRNAADPEHADSRRQGALRLFGISATGYQSMGSVISSAKAKLDAVRSSQSEYVSVLTRNTPPSAAAQATFQSFYQQQLAILRGVSLDLRAQLGPADWAALQSFITTELTGKIKVGMSTGQANRATPLHE